MKKNKIKLLSSLTVCLLIFIFGTSAFGITYGDTDPSFSGVDATYKVLADGAAAYFDPMKGVSATQGLSTLTVKVMNVTLVHPDKEYFVDKNTINSSVTLDSGRINLKTDSADNGDVYWITYGAFKNSSDAEPIGTVKRPVVVVPQEFTPYMYAVSSTDEIGATAFVGDTVTYTVTVSNSSKNLFAQDGDTFYLVCPIPSDTEFVSASEGYTLTGNGVEWSVPMDKDDIKSVSYTVKINDSAAGGVLAVKASYTSEKDFFGDRYFTNNSSSFGTGGTSILTEIGGEIPQKTYKVVYDANNGVNPPVDNTEYYAGDTVKLLSGGNMVRPGYKFLGWARIADAVRTEWSVAALEAGTASYTFPAEPFEDVMTFYAVWAEDENAILVDVNWGNMNFTYDDGIWDPDTHTYTGGSWSPDSTDGNKIVVKNNGKNSVDVGYSYTQSSSYQNISGKITDALGNSKTSSTLASANSEETRLQLSGTPGIEMDGVRLGIITITIGGAS